MNFQPEVVLCTGQAPQGQVHTTNLIILVLKTGLADPTGACQG